MVQQLLVFWGAENEEHSWPLKSPDCRELQAHPACSTLLPSDLRADKDELRVLLHELHSC